MNREEKENYTAMKIATAGLFGAFMASGIINVLKSNVVKNNRVETAEIRDISGDGLGDIVVRSETGYEIPLIAVPQEDGSTTYCTLDYIDNQRNEELSQRIGELESISDQQYGNLRDNINQNLTDNSESR